MPATPELAVTTAQTFLAFDAFHSTASPFDVLIPRSVTGTLSCLPSPEETLRIAWNRDARVRRSVPLSTTRVSSAALSRG